MGPEAVEVKKGGGPEEDEVRDAFPLMASALFRDGSRMSDGSKLLHTKRR